MCRSMVYLVGEECWNIKPVLLEMIVVGYDSFQLSGLLFYGFSFTFLFGRTFYSPSRFCFLLAINTIFFYPIKEIVAYLMCFVIDNLSTCHFVTELNFLFYNFTNLSFWSQNIKLGWSKILTTWHLSMAWPPLFFHRSAFSLSLSATWSWEV